ncbi:MAG: hypothetical protein JKY45_09285 [Emcibacter sp.]|nr:hypothetical protein [Emcibacter sp.]
MKLSEHFSDYEMTCPCGCGFDEITLELLDMLEVIRRHFGQPVTITSACRCEGHNKAVGGKLNSRHRLAMAADIQVRGIMPAAVYAFADKEWKISGLGRYKTFTHIDCRGYRARW